MEYVVFAFIAIAGLEFLLKFIFQNLSGFLLVLIGIIGYIAVCFVLALFARKRNDNFFSRFFSMVFELPIFLIVIIIIAVVIS